MAYYRILLFAIALVAGVAGAFADDTDALREKMATLSGKPLLNAYEQLYAKIKEADTDEQLQCLNEWISESQRQKNKESEAEAMVERSWLFYNNGLDDSTIAVIPNDLKVLAQHGMWNHYYEMWTNLVNTYIFTGQNTIGLREVQTMFNEAVQRNDKYGMGIAYQMMGKVYTNMGSYEESIDNFQKGLDLLSELKPLPVVLGDLYTSYGDALNEHKNYERLEKLTVSWREYIEQTINTRTVPEDYANVMWAYYYIARTQAALGLDKLDEAATMLEDVGKHTTGGDSYVDRTYIYYQAQLALQQGNYAEALRQNNRRLTQLMQTDDQSVLITVRRQRASIMEHLGRFSEAATLYREMYEIKDSTTTNSIKNQLNEMNTIFQVDELKMEQERAQYRNIIIIASIIVLSLVIFIYFRIRSARRLKAAHEKLELAHGELEKTHNDLLTAYDQLEETTAAKERIESDLRIARDIQMSMVPRNFPDRPDLDIFASMVPAKEVGGDLYGYLLLEDKLYFALGDVSGKGVPASLFMAQATRLFRTLAAQEMMPAEICTRINDALSGEDNERGMFVTMFMGLVDLKTGHLIFCNAGHNPPVLITEGKSEFIEMIPNAPIGLWPGLEYEGEEIESIMDTPLFIYSDGLNEAENREQEQFSDERLLDLLATTPFESAQQTISMLSSEVEKHRDGAEPNDDLTMLCVKVRTITENQ